MDALGKADRELAKALDKFNRVKAAASARTPTTMVKQVTKRDEQGRITEVVETPVMDPQVPNADDVMKVAGEVAAASVEAVQEAKRQGSVTAGQLSSQMAEVVMERVVEIAEEAAQRHVEEVIEDFKREQDEDPYEEEDDDLEASAEDDLTEEDIQEAYGQDEEGHFRTKAAAQEAFEQDLTAIVQKQTAPIAREVALIAERQKAIRKQTLELDGLTYLLKELGSWKNVRRFFKAMRRKSLKDPDHPFRTDPRLRVFMFPDDGPGRVSTETSAEHQADDNPDVQTDQMQDKWHGYRRRGHHRGERYDGNPEESVFMRQSLYGEKPADMPKDPDETSVDEIQDLTGVGGAGGQDFRAHRAPQADNVLMSEYRPRKALRGPVRKRGMWSGR
jgi:hypothetical protein